MQDKFHVGAKTHDIAIQLVLQQCCKTSCTLFVARFSYRTFKYDRLFSTLFFLKLFVSEVKRNWILFGLALQDVAPTLRQQIKEKSHTMYTLLDNDCQLLTQGCSLKKLTHHEVQQHSIFKDLKFRNINNNDRVRGKINYNYSINSPEDLAKLYLPGYLAQFSGFDESMDMSAILRLLGCKNYRPSAPFSPHTQDLADQVRAIRNKWAHPKESEWTEGHFKDSFSKLGALVRSLGLTADLETKTLHVVTEWETKGNVML